MNCNKKIFNRFGLLIFAFHFVYVPFHLANDHHLDQHIYQTVGEHHDQLDHHQSNSDHTHKSHSHTHDHKQQPIDAISNDTNKYHVFFHQNNDKSHPFHSSQDHDFLDFNSPKKIDELRHNPSTHFYVNRFTEQIEDPPDELLVFDIINGHNSTNFIKNTPSRAPPFLII